VRRVARFLPRNPHPLANVAAFYLQSWGFRFLWSKHMKTAALTDKRTAALTSLFALTLIAAVPGHSKAADVSSTDVNFCQVIGLEPDAQAACMTDLANATTAQAHHDAQDKWVAQSALATRFWGGSLYEPPVDANVLNGRPASVYASKPAFVSNQTAAAVQRALRDDDLYSGPYAR
jgi:hypothetical protein